MAEFIAHEIPQVPDAIVYIVNSEVTKIVPLNDVSKGERGFYFPVRDENGNVTLKYAKTSVIKRTYRDKDGKEVPLKDAVTVHTYYYDSEGNIIHRPLEMIIRK